MAVSQKMYKIYIFPHWQVSALKIGQRVALLLPRTIQPSINHQPPAYLYCFLQSLPEGMFEGVWNNICTASYVSLDIKFEKLPPENMFGHKWKKSKVAPNCPKWRENWTKLISGFLKMKCKIISYTYNTIIILSYNLYCNSFIYAWNPHIYLQIMNIKT